MSDTDSKRDDAPSEPQDGEATPAPELQAEIGVRLKAYYDTITREPVPDRFVELLGQLDAIDAPPSAHATGRGEDDS